MISNVKYTYANEGWRDQLVAVDGQPITYDEIGNPTTYLGHNLTWDRVRQLRKFDDVTFLYDVFGKRCRKNAIFYHYDVDNLIRERRNGECLDYFYDTTGIVGFKHSIFAGGSDYEAIYFYRKNLQGDIIAILDTTGTVVAEYAYDAWGKCTIISDTNGIGALNPIRYRGYYYDTETGLYYLKSRYYDPNTGRFINLDLIKTLSILPLSLCHKNLYAYCDNNPIVRVDYGGDVWHIVVGAVIGAIVSGVVSTASMIIFEKKFDWRKAVTSIVVGAVSGGLTAAAPGCSVAISSASSAVESVITDIIDEVDPVTIITNATISAGLGAVGGSWGDDISNPNLYDDAVASISKKASGNHPKVKNDAKKVITEASKQANKTAVNELVTATSIELISRPTKAVTKCYINMIW